MFYYVISLYKNMCFFVFYETSKDISFSASWIRNRDKIWETGQKYCLLCSGLNTFSGASVVFIVSEERMLWALTQIQW